MIGRRTGTTAFVAVLVFLALTTPAAAEWLTDSYAGASITERGSIDISAQGLNQTSDDQEYKKSFVVGGRVGYWWSFFGINLDINYFRPEFDPDEDSISIVDPTLGPVSASWKTDLQAFGVGANAMLRAQFIKDTAVPAGRLQPYVFGGPTVFISTLDAKGQGTAIGTTVTVDESDTSTKVGFTAGGGVTFLFTDYIGAFAEYRFTHFKPEFEGSQSIVSVKIKPELDTHHFIAGVTFRF